MIEIFKTNVSNERQAARVLKLLGARLPGCRFNFDLEDCDRILRAETYQGQVPVAMIIRIAEECNTAICVFED